MPPKTGVAVASDVVNRSPSRRRLAPVRRDAAELLDQTGHDPAELAENLRDIRRVNLLAGGTQTTLRALPALLEPVPRDRDATILDLATGSGDIPRAVVAWARRHRRPVRVVASDLSDEILVAAASHLDRLPEVTLARYDARAVPLPDDSFDVVLCSLALHHFSPEDAVLVLREMDRLGRYGFILNDIRRGALAYLTAWVSSRVATRNRLTRHDMPLSVLRAYTPDELKTLLAGAGIAGATVSRHPLFRMTAVRGLRTED